MLSPEIVDGREGREKEAGRPEGKGGIRAISQCLLV